VNRRLDRAQRLDHGGEHLVALALGSAAMIASLSAKYWYSVPIENPARSAMRLVLSFSSPSLWRI